MGLSVRDPIPNQPARHRPRRAVHRIRRLDAALFERSILVRVRDRNARRVGDQMNHLADVIAGGRSGTSAWFGTAPAAGEIGEGRTHK